MRKFSSIKETPRAVETVAAESPCAPAATAAFAVHNMPKVTARGGFLLAEALAAAALSLVALLVAFSMLSWVVRFCAVAEARLKSEENAALALAHLSAHSDPGGYAVKHGSCEICGKITAAYYSLPDSDDKNALLWPDP